MGKSNRQPDRTTTITEPPAYLKPGLSWAAQEASNIWREAPPQRYQGSTVVGYSPETEQAMAGLTGFKPSLTTQQGLYGTAARGLNGSPLVKSAQSAVMDSLNGGGQFLNPVLDATRRDLTRTFQETALPALQSQYSMAGRTGSGAFAQALGEQQRRAMGQVEDAVSRQRLDAFKNAIAQAPQLAGQDYVDLENVIKAGGMFDAQERQRIADLAKVGAQRETMSQALKDEEVNNFDFDANYRQKRLEQFLGNIQGLNTGGSKIESGPQQNRALQGLGGAMLGTTLAGQLGAGPWGLAAGAGAGLLAGWL